MSGTKDLSKIQEIQASSNTKIEMIPGLYKIQAPGTLILLTAANRAVHSFFSLIKMVVLKWGIRVSNVRILNTG